MKRLIRFAVVLQVWTFWAGPVPVQAGVDRQLLDFLLEAHRASRESIRTYSCDVDFTITITSEGSVAPITQTCSSHYWCSPSFMRARVSDGGDQVDYVWENFIRRGVIRRSIQGVSGVRAARDSYTNRNSFRCDPAIRGLLMLNVPNTNDYVPFEELVEKATEVSKIERTRIDGKELVLARLRFDKSGGDKRPWSIDIYFNPDYNYLISKAVYSVKSRGGYLREEEIQGYKEFGPGVFFPEQSVGRAENQGKPFSTSSTKMTNIQVNQQLPKDVFVFKYPYGVYLTDGIRGCEYRIDQDGNPISKHVPLGHETPPPAREEMRSISGTETQEEPKSALRWILPISMGVLLVAGVAAFRRRVHGQA